MELIVRAAAIGIVGAIFGTVVKKNSGAVALALTLACVCMLFYCLLEVLKPLIGFVQQLQGLANVDPSVLSPLLKTVGIGIVTELAATVCADAGESSLAKLVQLCGAGAALYAALPLMNAVLELLKNLIGG